jgi:tRNA-dihydrouridine synthase B
MHILDIFSQINTPVFLAPQYEVSESPFRRICKRLGADVVLTEFVSADRIILGNRDIRTLKFNSDERPIGVQIFGSDTKIMLDASQWIEDTLSPDFIDINFGCPSKTVVKANGGSACLKDLKLVYNIIKSVSQSISTPVRAQETR